jgi:hypothetical protein
MDPRVEKLKSAAECEAFIANARERGREDLALEAHRHSVELRVRAHGAKSTAEEDCVRALHAYEEAMEFAGKPAKGTWTLVRRHGLFSAVDRIVSRPDDDERHAALATLGLEALSLEAAVTGHPEEFSFEAVERSRERLARWKAA